MSFHYWISNRIVIKTIIFVFTTISITGKRENGPKKDQCRYNRGWDSWKSIGIDSWIEWIKSCFDMGNSASYGYDPEICIETISEYLGSVHIKDRKLHGSSVTLGEGNVNFDKVFESLNRINFCGPISFQIYRNRDSDDISLLKNSLTFINEIISKSVND